MQISGSNGTTKPADYQPGINNMGLFNYAKSVVSTAVNTPVHALLRSFRDNVLAEHVTPVPGSVLYCDLAAGYAEHSGIYVGGDGTKCIVELSRQQGRCVINLVSPGEFISGGIGFSIYVSSRNGHAMGKKSVARAALELVGQDLGSYNIAINNCHMFTCLCLCKKDPDLLRSIANAEMTLSNLKDQARKVMKADEWRVWDDRTIPFSWAD